MGKTAQAIEPQPQPQPQSIFDGVKVFSATKFDERSVLGETVTRWMDANPNIVIVDKLVTQSSDQAFHCITITLFYRRIS